VLALEGRLRARGLRVVGVTVLDPEDEPDEKKAAEEAAREEKMDYPTYLDAGGKWSVQHGLVDIPAFVVIDADGRVAHRYRGKLVEGTPAFAELERALDKALARPPGR